MNDNVPIEIPLELVFRIIGKLTLENAIISEKLQMQNQAEHSNNKLFSEVNS